MSKEESNVVGWLALVAFIPLYLVALWFSFIYVVKAYWDWFIVEPFNIEYSISAIQIISVALMLSLVKYYLYTPKYEPNDGSKAPTYFFGILIGRIAGMWIMLLCGYVVHDGIFPLLW